MGSVSCRNITNDSYTWHHQANVGIDNEFYNFWDYSGINNCLYLVLLSITVIR